MNSTISSWTFGFGGWMGVLAGVYAVANDPENCTLMTLFLSPWLGGIGMYLLMYVILAWMNIAVQITEAMIQHDVLLAILTSLICAMSIVIVRQILDMKHAPRTPTELAAAESTQNTSSEQEDEYEEDDDGHLGDDESGISPDSMTSEEHSENEEDEGDETGDETEEQEDDDDTEQTGNETEEQEDDDDTEQTGNETEEQEDGDDTEQTGDETEEQEDGDETDSESENESKLLNQAVRLSEESSFENIQTPQLTAISRNDSSPIPHIENV